MQDLICEPGARLLSIRTTCKEENIDLCSSNSLSKYHLFVIFGAKILLPLKYLCKNVYGASAVKNDGCQELGKQQNVVQILLLTTGVGQRCLDGEEPAESTGASHSYRVIPVPGFWTPTVPPTNCWPEAPLRGGGGGHGRGGFKEGRMGGV